MKKSLLLILLAGLVLAPVANGGIGGIPGKFTFDSVGPASCPNCRGNLRRPLANTKRLVHPAGICDPGCANANFHP